MTARGYRGNELGLTRWQVEFVHEMAEAVRWRISDLVRTGMSFEDAKASAIKRARPSWNGLDPASREAMRRVTASYQFADLEPAAIRYCSDKFLAGIEERRGYKAGRIERWFYNTFGLTF